MLPFSSLRYAFCLILSALALHAAEPAAANHILNLVNTIPLPNTEGQINHITFDQTRRQLLIAVTGSNTVEVVDANTGKLIRTLADLREPQGIVFARDLNRFAVANSKNGSIAIFDSNTLEQLVSIPLKGDVDIVRYDPKPHLLWIGRNDEPGSLASIDLEEMTFSGAIKLDAHPTTFQLETGSSLLYVIVPKAGHIAVVDRSKMTITARWPISGSPELNSMVLDEIGHRLYLSTRNPSKLLVLNSRTGASVASLDLTNNADDLFFDPALHRILAIGADGSIIVIAQDASENYHIIDTVTTAPGAKGACYLVPSRRLYVAIPHDKDQQAEIRVYSLSPGGLH